MNKIYKVIYSKVKRCYVVVSEIAKGNTKSASSKVNAGSTTTALASLVLATLLLVGGTSTVYADATFVKLDNVGGKDGGVLTTGDVVTHNQNDYYTGVKAPSNLSGYDDNNRPFSVILGFNGDSKAANWNQYYWNYNANNKYWSWTNSLNTQFTPQVGRYTVILGYQAGTTGDYNTIIGPQAKAVATLGANNTYGTTGISKATALGHNATAIADAFGINAEFRKNHGTSIQDIEGGQQLAVGSNTVASGQATALGNDVYAVGIGSIAIGSDDNPAYYKDLITEYDKDTYFKSVYDIMNANAGGEKYGFGTAGTAKYSPTLAQGYGSIAIGTRSLAYDIGTTAVGALAFALKPGSTAIGAKSRAEGDKSISIGNRALTFADNTIAVGNEVQVVQQGGTGYGYKAYASGQDSIAIGTEVYANSKITNAENQYNVSSSSSSSSSSITPSQETKNGVSGVVRQEDGKNNAIVIGKNSAAIGTDTIAFGKNTTAKEDNSIAIGSGAKTYGTNSLAIGIDAKVENKNVDNYKGDKSMAIGYGAEANLNNSIALGVGSRTDYTQAEIEAAPWSPKDAFLIPTSSSTGVISVGSTGKERRIVRVAAGASDTDAVNVGQLRAALEKVNVSINGLSTSAQTHYRSINNGDGSQAGAFEKRVNVRAAYDEYVKLDKQYLTYLARKEYNNEQFDQKVLDSIKDQLDKYKAIGTASSIDFEQKAASLKSVEDTITLKVTKTYDQVLQEIDAAFTTDENADLGTDYNKTTLDNEKANNNFDNSGAKGIDGIAYGFKASVSNDSDRGIAIGLQAEVKNNSDDAIAIGKTAVVDNSQNAMAIGLEAKATSSGQAVVLGKGRTVTGSGNSVAIGQEAATTSSEKSVGVGFQNVITNSGSGVAIGEQATLTNSGSGVAIGKTAKLSSAQNSVAIGLNTISNSSPYSIAIGDNAQNLENNATTGGTLAEGSNMQNIAIGNVAKTNNSVAGIALGKGAKINDGATSGSVSNAIAIGTEAKVNADKSIAIGSTANVSGSVESIAIGDRAKVTNSNYSTSIGINNEAKNGQTLLMLGTNLKSDNTRSYGSTDPNANNNSKSILMGNDLMIRDGSKKVIFIGNEKDGPVGGEVTRVVDHSDFAIAIGSGNIIQGDNRKIRPTGANNEAEEWDSSKYSVTLGSYNTVTSSMYGITIGNNNSHGNNTYYARGKNYRTYKNVVIGNNNAIFGTNDSVYIGNNIQQNGDYPTYKFYNIAIGYNVRPGGVESITMGKDATTKENKAIAIGSGAVANKQYNVVLGAGSVDGTTYHNGDAFGGTYSSTMNGVTKSYADNNDIRVVSVGGGSDEAPLTRRIINVTGGKNDTDAVNMAQLKSLATNQISFTTDGNTNATSTTTKVDLGDMTKKGVATITGTATNDQTRLQFGIKGWVPPATTGTATTTTTTSTVQAEVQSIETTANGKNVFIKVKDGGITEAKLSKDVKDKLNANVITKGTVTVNNGITKTGTGQVVGGDLTLSLDFASAVDKQNGNENKVVKAGQVKDALDLKANKNADNITTNNWVTKLSTGASLTTPTGVLVTDTAVKSALDDKANKNLGNIDTAGENKIKDEAIKAVKVAVTGNGLTLNTTTNESTTHEKTYTLSLDFANAIDKNGNANKPVSAGQVADALAGKVNTSDLNTTLGGYTKIDGTNLTNIAKDKWAEALGNGTIGGNTDSNLVTGATVKTELDKKINKADEKNLTAGTGITVSPNAKVLGVDTTISLSTDVTDKLAKIDSTKTYVTTGDLTSYAKTDASNITGNKTDWVNALSNGANLTTPTNSLVTDTVVKAGLDGKINTSEQKQLIANGGIELSGAGKILGEDTTISIANDGVTETKIAADAVTTAKIKDQNVTKTKLSSAVQTTLDAVAGKLDTANAKFNISDGTNTKEIALGTTAPTVEVNGDNTTIEVKLENDKLNVKAKTAAVTKDANTLVTGGAVESYVTTALGNYAKLDASNLDATNKTAWTTALGTGSVAANNSNLVTGGAVQTALDGLTIKYQAGGTGNNTRKLTDGLNFNGTDGEITSTADAGGNITYALDTAVKNKLAKIDASKDYATTLLDNLDNKGIEVIKDNAMAAVTVAESGGDISISTNNDSATTHNKTYTLSLNKATDIASTGNANKVATAGIVKTYVDGAIGTAKTDLTNLGFVVSDGNNESTTKLGKKVSIVSSGTDKEELITTSVANDGAEGSRVTLGINTTNLTTKLGTGEIADKNGNLVTGGKVKEYVDSAINNVTGATGLGSKLDSSKAKFNIQAGSETAREVNLDTTTPPTVTVTGDGPISVAFDGATGNTLKVSATVADTNAKISDTANSTNLVTAGGLTDYMANNVANIYYKVGSATGTGTKTNSLDFVAATGDNAGLVITDKGSGKVEFGLSQTNKTKLDLIDTTNGVANKNLSNLNPAGENKIKEEAVKAVTVSTEENSGINITVDPNTTTNKNYKLALDKATAINDANNGKLATAEVVKEYVDEAIKGANTATTTGLDKKANIDGSNLVTTPAGGTTTTALNDAAQTNWATALGTGTIGDGTAANNKDNNLVTGKTVNTAIEGAKTALTNLGLTFSDGTTDKTTKLGKKVTINGGTGTNEYITTTISQDANGNTSYALGINATNLTTALGTGTIGDGTGADNKDNNLVTGKTVNTAIEGAKKELQKAIDSVQGQLGPQGATGIDGATGPSGADGLNGKTLAQKVQAGRDGLSGSMVYTDKAGDRLEKVGDDYFKASDIKDAGLKQANDGKYYNSPDVNPDGTVKENAVPQDVKEVLKASNKEPVATKDIQVTAVNPDGSTKTPTAMGNVASGLGLTNVNTATPTAIGVTEAKTAATNLLTTAGKDLNKVATVGDLQALAQAGLDVKDGQPNTVTNNVAHLPLGSSLKIQGKADTTADGNYSSDNLATMVDSANKIVTISMLKTPKFDGINLKDVSLTPSDNGSTLTLSNIKDPNAADKGVVITGVKDGTTDDSAVSKKALDEVKNSISSVAQEAVKLEDGKNTTVNSTLDHNLNVTYTVDVNSNLEDIDSITNSDGSTTLNITDAGLTLNDRKIDGLAEATLSSSSTEAVSGKQLVAKAKEIADALGGGATISETNGDFTQPTYKLKTQVGGDIGTTVGSTNDGGTGGTYKTVGDALTAIDSGLAKLKNDGLNFAGDTATATQTAKLTKKVQITGGTTDTDRVITSSVASDNADGVIVTLGIDAGKLTTKLATGTIGDGTTADNKDNNLVSGKTV